MTDLMGFIPQGTAVSAVLAVGYLLLVKYFPTLIKEFKDTNREDRELFRGEMKEQRETFTRGLKEVTDAFTHRDEVLTDRIDGLADEVKGLKDKMSA